MASAQRQAPGSSLFSPVRSHAQGHSRVQRTTVQSDMLPPIAALKLDARSTGNSQDALLPISVNTRSSGYARKGADSAATQLDVRGVGGRKVAGTTNPDGASPITRTGRKLLLALTETGALSGVSYANTTLSTGSVAIGANAQQQKPKKQRTSAAGQVAQPKLGASSALYSYAETDAEPKDKARSADRLPIIQKSNTSDQTFDAKHTVLQSMSSTTLYSSQNDASQTKQLKSKDIQQQLQQQDPLDTLLSGAKPRAVGVGAIVNGQDQSPGHRLTLAQELGLVTVDSTLPSAAKAQLSKPSASAASTNELHGKHMQDGDHSKAVTSAEPKMSASSASHGGSLDASASLPALPTKHVVSNSRGSTVIDDNKSSEHAPAGSLGSRRNSGRQSDIASGHGSERRSREGTDTNKRSRESANRARLNDDGQLQTPAPPEVRLFSPSGRVLKPCKAEQLMLPKCTERNGMDDTRTFLTTPERAELQSFEGMVYFMGKKTSKIYGKPGVRSSKTGPYYDDDSGSYIAVNPSDHIGFRYAIKHELGSGSFGSVLCCHDFKHGVDVAVKVIKSQSKFTKQAQTELKILNMLNDDSEAREKAHCIKLLGYFSFRSHVCFSFPLYGLNLYDYLKANNFKGVSFKFIKRLAIQIFELLDYLRTKGVVHLDLKPENILLQDEATAKVVVIDFGSSCMSNVNPFTYVQSRFYRAPEVLLGCTYGPEVDMWSAACILPEMRSSMPLFPGKDEVDQFGCIVECLNLPPQEMMDRGNRKHKFFDSKGRLLKGKQKSGTTGEEVSTRVPGSKTISQLSRARNSSDDAQLSSLLALCLHWEPGERVTPKQALAHPWLLGKE